MTTSARDASGSLTYVGHATVLLDLGGVRLLTDPVLRSRVAHLRRQGPAPDPPRDLDAVLISHLHRDHLDLPSLRMLDRRARLVAPRGAGEFLRRHGHREVTELAAGESTDVGGARITATPALHDGRRRPFGGPVAAPVGFQVEAAGRRVYFAGDTDLFDGMADLAGGLDLALVPVWGWGPALGAGHLDPVGAAQAVAMLQPRLAVPIHWGSLFRADLTRRRPELLRDPPRDFAAQVAAVAPGVEVRVVEPGASLEL